MMWPERETIGPDECPLFYRWTLLAPRIHGRVPFKLMVHRFIPNRQDADVPHDHPRGFITLVLRGGYDDLVLCPACGGCERIADPELLPNVGGTEIGYDGEEFTWSEADCWMPCPTCSTPERGPTGLVLAERLNAPAVRRRRAEHAHMTRTDGRGAWTLVVMGPERRAWGFWRLGRWWNWREFEQRFGFTWRCEEPDHRFASTPEPEPPQ